MYETSYDSSEDDTFSTSDIAEMSKLNASPAFARRILSELVEDGECILFSNDYEEDLGYSLTAEGWVAAEESLSHAALLDAAGIQPNLQGPLEVPASDRFVALDHNSADVVELIAQTDDLITKLTNGNDVGNLTSDMVSVAVQEVGQLKAALEVNFVRPTTLFLRASDTLHWIGKEAAGALVGAAALALLALIAAFFGAAI